MPVTLIPVNPNDKELMALMTRATSPRWMRVAACLAMEGRKVVLPKDGHPVMDVCSECGADGLCTVHAFHKDGGGEDVRCLLACGACGRLVEDRSFTELLAREGNPLMGIDEAF